MPNRKRNLLTCNPSSPSRRASRAEGRRKGVVFTRTSTKRHTSICKLPHTNNATHTRAPPRLQACAYLVGGLRRRRRRRGEYAKRETMVDSSTPIRGGTASWAASPKSPMLGTTTISLPYSTLRASKFKNRLHNDNDLSSRSPDVRRRAEMRAHDFSPAGRPRGTPKVRGVCSV